MEWSFRYCKRFIIWRSINYLYNITHIKFTDYINNTGCKQGFFPGYKGLNSSIIYFD